MDWYSKLTSGVRLPADKNTAADKQTYIDAFNRAVDNANRTPSGKKMISEWEASGRKPEMIWGRTSISNDKSDIAWDPFNTVVTTDENGKILSTISTTSSLLHEVSHLLDPNLKSNINKPYPGKEEAFKNNNKINYAEYHAIEETNKYRKEIGETLRKDYENTQNKLYPVDNPSVSEKYKYDNDGRRTTYRKTINIDDGTVTVTVTVPRTPQRNTVRCR